MGWFKSETNITELQKAVVVSLSGTLIGLEAPNLNAQLAVVRKMIGITEQEFNNNVDALNSLISMWGLNALNSFPSLSKAKRREIKDIFSYALNNGINTNNPDVNAFYKEIIRRLKI